MYAARARGAISVQHDERQIAAKLQAPHRPTAASKRDDENPIDRPANDRNHAKRDNRPIERKRSKHGAGGKRE